MSYYDRHGKPMTLIEWASALEGERRVDVTEVNGLTVSTVWLGLDHNFGHGPPLIFETMVFERDEERDGYAERYATLAAAEAGHRTIVALVRHDTHSPPWWS